MGIDFKVKIKAKDIEKIVVGYDPPVKVEINMTQIKSMFKNADTAISGMVTVAEDLKVTGSESRDIAIEMGTQSKTMMRILDEKRKEIKQPYLKFGQELDGLMRPIKKMLDDIQNGLLKKIKCQLDAENKRKADQEKNRLEVEAALNPAFEKPDLEIVTQNSKPVIESKHVTESGSASLKKVWKFKVNNIDEIPSGYLMVNESAIELAIERGIREIPGIEIYEDSNIKFTSARKGGPLNARR